jgi:hypothetical protein
VIRTLAAGRVVAPSWGLVKSFAAAGLLLTGCFYVDPINQRPSIDIHQQSSDAVHRGDHIVLDAKYDDPEGQDVTFEWSAFACTEVIDRTGVRSASDAIDARGCDDAPFYTGTEPTASLGVPVSRSGGAPVEAIRVVLAARDDRGAAAKPSQELVIHVADAPPTLELRKVSRHGYVVGTPIDLFAQYGDPDDGPGTLGLAWKVFTPNTQPAFTLADLAVVPDGNDPAHATSGKTLTPQGIGEWDVRVIASDPLGEATEQHVAITVAADRPPCLAQWQPIAPPGGATLPVTDPTVFRVPLVDDDLDVYPPVPGDPVLGTTTFAWSILPAGGSIRQALVGATGNSVDFDPRAFTPGEIVELRVEIFDRAHPAIPCADDVPICPASPQPGCIQRQTWRVEVR